jgi:hypothetical protein
MTMHLCQQVSRGSEDAKVVLSHSLVVIIDLRLDERNAPGEHWIHGCAACKKQINKTIQWHDEVLQLLTLQRSTYTLRNLAGCGCQSEIQKLHQT